LASRCRLCGAWYVLGGNTELDKIDPFNRAAPEVLALRIAIYRGLEKWELMQEIAKRLAEFPARPHSVDNLARICDSASRFDSGSEGSSAEGRAEVSKEAAIKYNLACYFCQTGDIQNAKNYLKKAFEIDLNWRVAALDDIDLQPIWDSI
jgi:hypothetical protein